MNNFLVDLCVNKVGNDKETDVIEDGQWATKLPSSLFGMLIILAR